MGRFEDFSVLLDTPSDRPALGFDGYSDAFAEIISKGRPQFSIGIFGGWGSGKTTLMQSILGKVSADPTIVPVWFNAWRYEREAHLIVPMLDTLREAILKWSQDKSEAQKGSASKIAALVGRAARAILAGLSFSADFHLVGASVDASKVLEDWKRSTADDAQEPKSFYHASFRAMEEAVEELRNNGLRVAVFIDDLDRCLPESALQVLESMKLFFDLDGFIFVVGLDQAVIERAVAVKYQVKDEPPRATTTAGNGAKAVSGADYVKKIFQVPFGVPPIRPTQLRPFLDAVKQSAGLSNAQRADLDTVVWPHLMYLAEQQSVNPREIKRFINSYTMQLKLLDTRLGPSLDPNRVLAIQAMNFRSDWRDLFDVMAADPTDFVNGLSDALQDGYWPDRKRTVVPPTFRNYVDGPGAALRAGSLEEYISSAEATQYTDSAVLEMSKAIRDLWRSWGRIGQGEDLSVIGGELKSSISLLMSPRIEGQLGDSVNRRAQELAKETGRLGPDLSAAELDQWSIRFSTVLESIEADIDERRRLTSVGGTS